MSAQEHSTMTWPGLGLAFIDLEFSMLAVRLVCKATAGVDLVVFEGLNE